MRRPSLAVTVGITVALGMTACSGANPAEPAPGSEESASPSPLGSAISETGATQRNANNVEVIPGWPIDETNKESSIILEGDQTPEEVAKDFVQSLETIYNANLQEASDVAYERIQEDPNSVVDSLEDAATENADTSMKLLDQLLPENYETNSPQLTNFVEETRARNLTRTWLYAWTNPAFGAPIESMDVNAEPESLVTEDVFTDVDVTSESEDKLSMRISVDSTPLNLENTDVRSEPEVYEKINEGSTWTSDVTFEKERDHWVVTGISSKGETKRK